MSSAPSLLGDAARRRGRAPHGQRACPSSIWIWPVGGDRSHAGSVRRDERIRGVAVALGAEDGYWGETAYAAHPEGDPRGRRGGALSFGPERPRGARRAGRGSRTGCWSTMPRGPVCGVADLDRLIESLVDDEVGGLLGIPVRDTMKRADWRRAHRRDRGSRLALARLHAADVPARTAAPGPARGAGRERSGHRRRLGHRASGPGPAL